MSVKKVQVLSGADLFYARAAAIGIDETGANRIVSWVANGKKHLKPKEALVYLELFRLLGRSLSTKPPSILYRGMSASRPILIELFRNKTWKLDGSILESWTGSPRIAAKYTSDSEVGLILKAKPARVVFVMNSDTRRSLGLPSSYVYNKDEVIVKGTLLPRVRLADVAVIRLYGKLMTVSRAQQILHKEGFL